jgi:ADP-ribosylglycohydrolase
VAPRADRIAHLLLGLADGDSRGSTSEGTPPRERRAAHGEIRDHLSTHHADRRPLGLPSDDTHLAVRTDGFAKPPSWARNTTQDPNA